MQSLLPQLEDLIPSLKQLLAQFPYLAMPLKVVALSIVLGESLRLLLGLLINGNMPIPVKQKVLHMKAVLISTVLCPYVYITLKMIADNTTDIRDFSFVLITPICLLIHIVFIQLGLPSLVKMLNAFLKRIPK